MKLKNGHKSIVTPPIGQLHSALLVDDDISYPLLQIRPVELDALTKKLRGVSAKPVCFAHFPDTDLMCFPTTADKDYEIRIAYYPPMVEA